MKNSVQQLATCIKTTRSDGTNLHSENQIVCLVIPSVAEESIKSCLFNKLLYQYRQLV